MEKEKSKHRWKQAVSVMTAAALVVSTLMLVPAREVKAGPTAWIIEKVAGTAVELCKSAIIGTIGYAADKAENEALEQVVEVVDGILGGNRSMEQQCKQIADKLDHMDAELQQISQMNQRELEELYKLLEKTQRDSIDQYRNPILNLYKNTYKPALDIYEEYIDKAQAYSEAVTAGQDAEAEKKAAKTAEKELANQFGRLDFEGDIRTVKDNADDDGTQHLYLYQVDQYCRLAYPFDHQRFQMLENSIDDVVLTLAYIGYTNRLYYDYYSAKAQNDKSIDIDLIESQTLRHLNDIIKTINKISSQYANYNNDSNWGNRTDMLRMMRPYDVDTEYKFKYLPDCDRTGYYEDGMIGPGKLNYRSKVRNTKETMPVSRVAINGKNFLVVRQELDFEGMRYWQKEAAHGIPPMDYYGFPNQDFYNIQETADGIYKLPSHINSLVDFTMCDSFLSSQNIAKYLKQNGISVNENSAYVALDSFTSPAERVLNSPLLTYDYYTKYLWGTTGLNGITEVSTSDQTPNDPLLAILRQKGAEKEKHTIHAASSGSGSVQVTDMSGNDVNGKQVEAGARLQIHVQADKGADLSSLEASSPKVGLLKTFANREIMNMLEDGNHACTFTWVMPYQDCTINADFINVEGEGTEESPYLIATFEDLRELVEIAKTESSYASAHYRVTADIDFKHNILPGYIGGNGTFLGVFDGGGHQFTYINSNILFKDVGKGALVKDMIVDANYSNPGCIVYGDNAGTIRNCHYEMTFHPAGPEYTGGGSAIVGNLNEKTGIIQDCSSTVPVKEPWACLGGMARMNQGKVINCFNGGELKIEKGPQVQSYMGGIVGYNGGGEIINCYNYGAITDQTKAAQCGPIIGQGYFQKEEKNYYLNTCIPPAQSGSYPGVPLNESFMRSDSFKDQLNETALANGWRRWERSDTVNGGYPYLALLGNMRNLTLNAEHGSIHIKDMAGNSVTSPIEAGTPLAVTLSPEQGYDAVGLVLERTGSQTTEDIQIEPQPDGTATAAFTMPDEDCNLTAQFIKTHAFPSDDDGTILIPDYETLKEVAQAVRDNPARYAGASYRVTNDIINVQKPENYLDWPLSIGNESNPFTGNFDGGGFDIGGIKQDISATGEKYGGLFGVVGPGGTIHDVHVYAFNMTGGKDQTMGAIAGNNQGLINNCSSGSAQTSGAHYGDIDIDDMRNLNVTITSYNGGGIAGELSGTILNCSSGADVTADADKGHAGGIAGITAQGSKVSNGYAMGKIKANQSGGIVGRSYSHIDNAYFCGSVEGETAGGIVGANHHEVKNTYSINTVSKMFGSGYGEAVSMEKSEMTIQSFADTLNKYVSKDMYYWTWDAKTHHGYPTLAKDPMVQRTVVDPDTGISITGTLHAAAVLNAERLKEAHQLYKELAQHIKKGKMLGAFDINMQVLGGKKGQKAFAGSIKITFPLAAEHKLKNIIILHQISDGEVLVLEDVAITDNTVSVHVKKLSPFAIVAAGKEDIRSTIKTGDTSNVLLPVILCTAALFAAGGVILYRRRKRKHEKNR